MPENLPAGDVDPPTQAVFEKCDGHDFTVAGFNEVGWAELIIESVPLGSPVHTPCRIDPATSRAIHLSPDIVERKLHSRMQN